MSIGLTRALLGSVLMLAIFLNELDISMGSIHGDETVARKGILESHLVRTVRRILFLRKKRGKEKMIKGEGRSLPARRHSYGIQWTRACRRGLPGSSPWQT